MSERVATNWDAYYAKTVPTAHLTRAYTLSWLRSRLLEQRQLLSTPLDVIELGGGNSCFAAGLTSSSDIGRYHIVDLNQASLELFRQRLPSDRKTTFAATRADLLVETPHIAPADVVFSVGLVEHFDPIETDAVARRHFELVKPGGMVVMTAPTPTFLYRMVRGAAELTGQWAFPDERPIGRKELLQLGQGRGALLRAEILWPLILTQYAAAWRAPV